MMKAVSRGAVDVVWCAVVVVFEGAIQLMKPMLAAKVEPVEQPWASGAGGGTKVGAGGEVVVVVGTIFLSTSLCG